MKKKVEIENVKELLLDTDKFIVQTQSIIQDSELTNVVQLTADYSNELIGMKFKNEIVNFNYIRLQEQENSAVIELKSLGQELTDLQRVYLNTKKIIEEEINDLSTELELLNVEFAEQSNAEKLITKDVERAELSYDQFVKSYEDTRVAESADIGKSTIIVNSLAMANEDPIGPNLALNLIIGLVMSIIVSSFIVLFRHYWLTDNESL